MAGIAVSSVESSPYRDHAVTSCPFVLVAAFIPWAGMRAQLADTTVHVAVGFGVDTVGNSNHEIFALWRTYLVSRPSCGQQSPLWSATERARWPLADLLCSYVYQGFSKFT